MGLESQTHSLVDHSLQTLPVILPVLDFTTIKNELFPVVANVFSKTSSMSIKIQGLHALNALCGGTAGPEPDLGDGLDGVKAPAKAPASTAALDKYTIQEKVVPLLRAIKTKEPSVMVAALAVFKQVGKVADTDFLAIDVLPCLWSFSLGPLLNLGQFQEFMKLIKSLSSKIEQEQSRKLTELSSNSLGARTTGPSNFGGSVSTNGLPQGAAGSNDTADFESLVTGRNRSTKADDLFDGGWTSDTGTRPSNFQAHATQPSASAPRFNWQTAGNPSPSNGVLQPSRAATSGTITPDNIGSFAAMTPSQPPTATNPFNPPLQPQLPLQSPPLQPFRNTTTHSSQPLHNTPHTNNTSIDWSRTSQTKPIPQVSRSVSSGPAPTNSLNNFSLSGSMNVQVPNRTAQAAQPNNRPAHKQGLDQYESLI